MEGFARWLLQLFIHAVAIECAVRWGRLAGWGGAFGGAVVLVILGIIFMYAGLPSLEKEK